MVKIFATDVKTGKCIKINDLYWFQENGIHDWGGVGHSTQYVFDFEISGRPEATILFKPNVQLRQNVPSIRDMDCEGWNE